MNSRDPQDQSQDAFSETFSVSWLLFLEVVVLGTQLIHPIHIVSGKEPDTNVTV
jgi:hypothetical protein